MLKMAIHRIRHQHRRHNLIPRARNRDSHNRRHIPMHRLRLRRAHTKHNQAHHSEQEPRIRQPQPILRRRRATSTAGLRTDEPVAERAGQLLADNGADDDAEELQADLLRVEGELGQEELGDLDGDEDGGEAEDDAVRDRGHEDGGVAGEEEGFDEFDGAEGRWVDAAADGEVFLLEGGPAVGDAAAHVACFGAEEEVEDELDAVDLGEEG